MRSSNVLMLASLASYALALPTDLNSRALSSGSDLVSDVVNDLTGLLSLLLGDGGQSPASLLDGLTAPAAAALEGGALGCKANAVHASARKELGNWLQAHGDAFHAPVKKSLLGWCNGGGDSVLPVDVTSVLSMLIPTCADKAAQGNLIVTLDGIFDAVEYVTDVVLNASAQSSLSSFLSGTIGSLLDVKVKAGLGLCASGGVARDLSVEVKTSLLKYLTGSDCTLGVSLKSSLLSWLHGKAGGDCMALDSLPTGGLSAISVGAAVESLVTEAGVLVETVQATLAAFLKTDLAAGLEEELISALTSCSKGGSASVLTIEVRTILAKWLGSSDCHLGAELKSVLVFWLSFAVTEVDVNIELPGGLISEVTSFVTGTVDSLLGTHLTGILSILTSGQSLISISIEARAQLAAVCGGAAGIEIGESIQLILIGWMTGCDTGHGSPSPSSSMALPSSTVPAIPSSTGAIPASSTPCDTLTSETVVPIATSTEVPSVPAASSTPCDTLTSETVVPIATSTEAVGPTGSPSSAPEASSTPCDTITSETVVPIATSTEAVPEASSTPCDTITSETVVPIATSTEAVGPTGTPSVPVMPTPSSEGPEASSTPCETITTETVVPVATNTEVGPEASSTPCETITTETVVPIATSTEAPQITAAPTMSYSKPHKVVTLHTTVSVASCPPSY
ncbi:hypothetical protein FE257_000454 [Aspergillus nanangensis]|uniref:Cell wall protein n=1 Tax=Aspergillus nanangensis TaxID=2582783 RepID=A0AAD4CUB3_ASPNN|nr:hypothetical protein FE257_000454 [Aspergillus nanangensis]